MKVVLLYDAGADHWSDADVTAVMVSLRRIGAILRAAGHQVQPVAARPGLAWVRACQRADLVYNFCEGLEGVSGMEPMLVGALELTGTPFTGCGARAVTLCHRKPVVNAWLASQGLPVPEWVMPRGHGVPADFPLPAIVKPAAEDASVGIDQGAVVTTRKALRQRVAALTEQFDDVIVQRYVTGREFNVGIVGTTVLPISEIDFSAMPADRWNIVSFEAKWEPGSLDDLGSQPVCPAEIPQALAKQLETIATAAWRAVGGSSYGRVDLRVDAEGAPWVIEVNPNPDLSEDAGLARMARAAGWTYDELVLGIANRAVEVASQAASVRALAAGASSRAERTARRKATPQ